MRESKIDFFPPAKEYTGQCKLHCGNKSAGNGGAIK